jgi:hypothetical protein
VAALERLAHDFHGAHAREAVVHAAVRHGNNTLHDRLTGGQIGGIHELEAG